MGGNERSGKTMATMGLSTRTERFTGQSCAGIDPFGATARTVLTGKVPSHNGDNPIRLSVFTGNNVSLPFLCCIIFETTEIINDSANLEDSI
jgi:hypothetical protein